MSYFARRCRSFADFDVRVVNMRQRLPKIADVEPLPATRGIHVMNGLAWATPSGSKPRYPLAFVTDLAPASGQGNEKAARNMSSGPPGSK
jgi:hypothetical protein